MSDKPILDQVKSYFDKRIQEFGASPRGSDWNSEDSQYTRFDQLLKVIKGNERFSIIDYGCGYGGLAEYLTKIGFDAEYYGFDILESAIDAAKEAHAGNPLHTFSADKSSLPVSDYVVASGIFNFCGGQSFESWTEFTIGILAEFNALSRRGFASNFLTKYSDSDKMRPDLYYADPLYLFDYCKRNFSKDVALLHDYHLYDFTLIVRKD